MSFVLALWLTIAHAERPAVFAGQSGGVIALDDHASARTPHRVASVRLLLLDKDFTLLDRTVGLDEFYVTIGHQISLRLSENREMQVRAALEGQKLRSVFLGYLNQDGRMVASEWLRPHAAASLLNLDWPVRVRSWIAHLCARRLEKDFKPKDN